MSREDRAALWVLLALHMALVVTLVAAGWTLLKSIQVIQLSQAQKVMFEVGIAVALIAFSVRGWRLWRRIRRTAARR